MEKRLRDNLRGRVKEQIRTNNDYGPADEDHARLDGHAETNRELGRAEREQTDGFRCFHADLLIGLGMRFSTL